MSYKPKRAVATIIAALLPYTLWTFVELDLTAALNAPENRLTLGLATLLSTAFAWFAPFEGKP